MNFFFFFFLVWWSDFLVQLIFSSTHLNPDPVHSAVSTGIPLHLAETRATWAPNIIQSERTRRRIAFIREKDKKKSRRKWKEEKKQNNRRKIEISSSESQKGRRLDAKSDADGLIGVEQICQKRREAEQICQKRPQAWYIYADGQRMVQNPISRDGGVHRSRKRTMATWPVRQAERKGVMPNLSGELRA